MAGNVNKLLEQLPEDAQARVEARMQQELVTRTLICTMGLPRCGKSTWARNQPFPVISPDAVRLALYGQRFWEPGEKMVWALVPLMVRTLFESGNNAVILDATNITLWQRDQWQSDEWETVFYHIDTPVGVCVERAVDTGQNDLIKVIAEMVERFEPLEEDEKRYIET